MVSVSMASLRVDQGCILPETPVALQTFTGAVPVAMAAGRETLAWMEQNQGPK
jgi:hypothetical protein